ncbi:L-serine ammonia-lyase, iron-sulfur-dependent, subunit alpha [Alicyclobacillus sp. SO9]|uniref:L-serine ammonia-lyase, iron-sulfur-dependent, subunit alpha n=1 Tax=Alicyclobacillus sp. SO9 TaxID=2665646 RepID=UPI0018E82552|nr:L-serine ammonia-lyase, iron-sulfur-dependent, subunit alpha [Alicyclobacillus sp. SO9]QQE77531.1 L-serine ammonia-lyase, iron-sulfur-dependent, subunit alpha [Alicyclobacillus sp. SO9]
MAFKRLHELIALANEKEVTIAKLMLETEKEHTGVSEEEILSNMSRQFDIMEEAARKGVEQPVHSKTGLSGGDAYLVNQYLQTGKSYLSGSALKAMAYALSVNEVNAGMGRIVATPTAGSAGVLPGVLLHVLETGRYNRDEVVFSLLTAAALGLVIANSASISGAAGGCQAEIGSATAMAAGALVELGGGTPEQVGHAVGLTLKNSMGLVCDPVGGLVEIPCIIRNGLHAVTALAAADMALAGVKSVIPPDQVIRAMYEIGNEMPSSLRETGLGGLAATPAGKAMREQVFGNTAEKPCRERERQ